MRVRGAILPSLAAVLVVASSVGPALAGTPGDDAGIPLSAPGGVLGLVAIGVIGAILLARSKK